jgi:hypothetical protein
MEMQEVGGAGKSNRGVGYSVKTHIRKISPSSANCFWLRRSLLRPNSAHKTAMGYRTSRLSIIEARQHLLPPLNLSKQLISRLTNLSYLNSFTIQGYRLTPFRSMQPSFLRSSSPCQPSSPYATHCSSIFIEYYKHVSCPEKLLSALYQTLHLDSFCSSASTSYRCLRWMRSSFPRLMFQHFLLDTLETHFLVKDDWSFWNVSQFFQPAQALSRANCDVLWGRGE